MRISDWSSDVCSSDLNADGITVHDGDTEIGTVEDVLLGTANDDSYGVDGYANGGAGDDDLFGGGSRDWLVGGTGDDDLYGGGAVDHLEGGAGDDTLSGGTGIDVMDGGEGRSEEHTSEIQSLMRISYAVFCLNKKQTSPPDI